GIGLGVPDRILQAIPSPDLQGNGAEHNDEDELKQLTGVDWTYSKVLLQDMPDRGLKRGDYIYVGTIEKMSRYLDGPGEPTYPDGSPLYFMHDSPLVEAKMYTNWKDNAWTYWADKYFPDMTATQRNKYIESATKIEAATRHKWNPNCPSLGTRKELVDAGILTNELPNI